MFCTTKIFSELIFALEIKGLGLDCTVGTATAFNPLLVPDTLRRSPQCQRTGSGTEKQWMSLFMDEGP